MCGVCLSVALGNGPWYSCVEHGEGLGACTKSMSTSTVDGMGCPSRISAGPTENYQGGKKLTQKQSCGPTTCKDMLRNVLKDNSNW